MFIFLLSILYFSLILPWNGFMDPDALYHAKMSALIWSHGPLRSFPWLDLTAFSQHFADIHFLFHLIVAPFTVLFGILNGARVATVLLSALCIFIFSRCLRWLNVQRPISWTVILLSMQPFIFRLLLGKATPIAIICFVIGICATWKRSPWIVGLVALIFSLSHAGAIILLVSIGLLGVGEALFDRIVLEQKLSEIIRRLPWREFIAACVGWILGFFIHPNFPANVRLSWTQIVTIGLGTPYQHVILGNEWLPSSFIWLITSNILLIIALFAGLWALYLAHRMPLDIARARFICGGGFVVAALYALTIKSQRGIEYAIPMAVLWLANLWSLIDLPLLSSRLRRLCDARRDPLVERSADPLRDPSVSSDFTWDDRSGRVRMIIIFVVIVSLMSFQVYKTWNSFRPTKYPDNVYQSSMQAISSQAQPGDRVFHSSWDEFPMLFVVDDRLKYISGLDPTFLYVASSTLSDQVRDVTWDVTTSTQEATWSLIHDQLRSRFVFILKKLHYNLYHFVSTDPRFKLLKEDETSAAFEVMEK